MGHAGASRKSPNDAPWETLSLRLSREIPAPLLTVARSWRHEGEDIIVKYYNDVTNYIDHVSYRLISLTANYFILQLKHQQIRVLN